MWNVNFPPSCPALSLSLFLNISIKAAQRSLKLTVIMAHSLNPLDELNKCKWLKLHRPICSIYYMSLSLAVPPNFRARCLHTTKYGFIFTFNSFKIVTFVFFSLSFDMQFLPRPPFHTATSDDSKNCYRNMETGHLPLHSIPNPAPTPHAKRNKRRKTIQVGANKWIYLTRLQRSINST